MTLTHTPSSLIPTLPGPTTRMRRSSPPEQERIFEQMWFCAVRSADLDKAGRLPDGPGGPGERADHPRPARAESAPSSTSAGTAASSCAWRSRARPARSFQCPYHAWTYDFDGKLIAAPNLTKMPDIDRDEYGLVQVHIREWLGYVWVCLADEPPSFEEDVMGAVDGAARRPRGDRALRRRPTSSVGRRIGYDVKANWKLIIENFMECYHCATIHPELTEVLPEFADG